MNKRMKNMLNAVLLTFLSLALMHCQDGGSELPNELSGQVVSQGGIPAARMKVGLYSVNYIPAESGSAGLGWTTQTDAMGHYSFKDIPPGRYNLVGIQDTLGFLRDSLSVSGDVSLGKDSLYLLGSLTGTVQLQPHHDPRNALVQVMGTDHYVNVAASGRFTLVGLPAGSYRLRVFVGLQNYVPVFKDVRVRAGLHDTLIIPLEPYYSGVPVVTGIKATLDTAQGIAKITWHPVDYPSLLTYLVYRDPANAVELNTNPLNAARLLDTVWYDTLYRFDSTGRTSGENASIEWEYRVRVKSKNSDIGAVFGAATLTDISPSIFATAIEVIRAGKSGDSSSSGDTGSVQRVFIGDTVRWVAHYSNPSLNHQTLTWVNGQNDTLRKVEIKNPSGYDTLIWVAPTQPATDQIRVTVLDAKNKSWSHEMTIHITAARMIGRLKTTSSEMEAYAWNGKIVHISTDTTGNISIGLFDPTQRKDSTLNQTASLMPWITPETWLPTSFAFSGSKLYLVQARHPQFAGANLISYDLATGLWKQESSIAGKVIDGGAIASGSKLYVVTGKLDGMYTANILELNLVTQEWTTKSRRVFPSEIRLSEYQGKIYARSSPSGLGFLTEIYDPLQNTWSIMPGSSRFMSTVGARMVGLNGKLYVLGGNYFMEFTRMVDVFDEGSQKWLPARDYLLPRSHPGVVALGSSLFILGGQAGRMDASDPLTFEITPTIEEYRPE